MRDFVLDKVTWAIKYGYRNPQNIAKVISEKTGVVKHYLETDEIKQLIFNLNRYGKRR